jgi:hypothetical protein
MVIRSIEHTIEAVRQYLTGARITSCGCQASSR